MKEILQSMLSSLKERTVSPFYGVLSLVWLAVNWQVLVVIIFVDENLIFSKTGLLKNEFIQHYLLDFATATFWIRSLIVLGLSVLIIWAFPKTIVRWAFTSNEKERVARRRITIQQNKLLEQDKAELLEQKRENIDKEVNLVESENKLQVSENESWNQEYVEFKKSPHFKDFNKVLHSFYSRHGLVKWGRGTVASPNDGINETVLAYLDSNGLLEMDVERSRFDLTTKGKYFVKLYTLEHYDPYEQIPF